MRLNLYEYDMLCLDDRLHLTWSVGVHLATLDNGNSIRLLFAVFDYYVELVAERHFEETVITKAIAFREGKRLDKYLSEIDLAELFN